MSSPKSLALLRHIVSCLDMQPHAEGVITEATLSASPFAKAKIGPEGIVGIRREAGEALSDLATELFNSPRYQRGTTFESLFNELGDTIIFNFFDKRSNLPTAMDVLLVESKIDQWFQAKIAAHELYIACSLSPWPATPFSVGPIMFMHVTEFERQEHQRMNAQMFDLTFGGMFKVMVQASVTWVATVAVNDCMQKRAQEIANLSVDIALAGLQLVVPLEHSARMSRLTARTLPSALQTVSRSNGQINMGSANLEPGLAMGEGTLHHFLTAGRVLVDAVGPRVTGFVEGKSALRVLDQAWADAAYWFHEALAEPLDTIAVPKLETAIEVLLRAENTSGSKSRLLKAIRAFYGLTKNQFINPHSQLTVEKFATGFVTDRSTILHGTRSTLNHSLRDSRPSLTALVRGLLARYAVELERYSKNTGVADNIEAFLTDVETHRQAISAAPPP